MAAGSGHKPTPSCLSRPFFLAAACEYERSVKSFTNVLNQPNQTTSIKSGKKGITTNEKCLQAATWLTTNTRVYFLIQTDVVARTLHKLADNARKLGQTPLLCEPDLHHIIACNHCMVFAIL